MDQEETDAAGHSEKAVREMQPGEQPREKLIRYGAESLSDAELFAILLRTGSTRMNVVETSRLMVEHFNGLRNLARRNWQELKVIPGIARVKAVTLESAFELARRIQVASLGDRFLIQSPEDAAAYFAPRLRDLTKEIFLVAFLNNAKRLTGYRKISSGGSTATIVDPAEVMRQAMMNEANSILLLHNHPSGQARESRADVNLTRRIVESGKLLGIPVDDHLIIAGDTFVSFRSRGLM
ncbi:MAG: DNA repair protein RadC [Balneolaceae bacterium]